MAGQNFAASAIEGTVEAIRRIVYKQDKRQQSRMHCTSGFGLSNK
jgi:hypothetical protein